MNKTAVVFTAPRTIALRKEALREPGAGEVRVKSVVSAISAGTEMLLYRGLFPEDTVVDTTIAALDGNFGYPMTYGYAAVGRIEALGAGVAPDWLGCLVFAFHPHESRFVAKVDTLIPLKQDVDPLNAVFIPNMETAVNLVMDGRPVLGETVTVFGQGVVGLLATALLARFPLSALITLDRFELRRRVSHELGADSCLDPGRTGPAEDVVQRLRAAVGRDGADLIFEVSGNPAALTPAIECAGFDARIVIGSWYGRKKAELNLAAAFHRRRPQLISSQVSTIAPQLSGRWDKQRRFEIVHKMIRTIDPQRLITHRFPLREAAAAYELIDQRPEETLQVVLTYD